MLPLLPRSGGKSILFLEIKARTLCLAILISLGRNGPILLLNDDGELLSLYQQRHSFYVKYETLPSCVYLFPVSLSLMVTQPPRTEATYLLPKTLTGESWNSVLFCRRQGKVCNWALCQLTFPSLNPTLECGCYRLRPGINYSMLFNKLPQS